MPSCPVQVKLEYWHRAYIVKEEMIRTHQFLKISNISKEQGNPKRALNLYLYHKAEFQGAGGGWEEGHRLVSRSRSKSSLGSLEWK